MPEIVKTQMEAIKAIKIDKITVWENGGGSGDGDSSLANLAKGFLQMAAPMHELGEQAGVKLPKFMGEMLSPKAVANGNGAAPVADIEYPDDDSDS
jgi:flotillin